MVASDDLDKLFEEMDPIHDCGVSSFDEDDEDSDTTEDAQDQSEDIAEVQNGLSKRSITAHLHGQTRSSHDLHQAESFMPSTTNEQHRPRSQTRLPSVVAAGSLSSGFVRSTSPIKSTASHFRLQQPTTLAPEEPTSQEVDSLFKMSRAKPRLIRNAQDFSFLEDNPDYQFPSTELLSTEAQEDILEEFERAGAGTPTRHNQEISTASQESCEPDAARRRTVRLPPIAQPSNESESRSQNGFEGKPNDQFVSDSTAQNMQQRAKPSIVNHTNLTSSSDGMQQTFKGDSGVQPTIQQTQLPLSQSTYPEANTRTQNPPITHSNRTTLRAMLNQINEWGDPLVQAILENAPEVDLSEPRLTDRCRGMEYIPFRTKEHMDRIHNEHNAAIQEITTRLRASITRRLGGTEAESVTINSKVATIENFLFVKATHILRNHFPTLDKAFADLEIYSRETAQFVLLHRLLQHIDSTIRPDGPVHMKNSMDSWEVAALKWQRDIHENWINDLDTGKKRRSLHEHDGGKDSVERPFKMVRKDESKKPDANPTRRPGRPPGSLNKSTMAKKEKEAANAREKGQHKKVDSLPEPTRDGVRTAHASAARLANTWGGPGSAILTDPRLAAYAPARASNPYHMSAQGQLYGQYQPQYQRRPQHPHQPQHQYHPRHQYQYQPQNHQFQPQDAYTQQRRSQSVQSFSQPFFTHPVPTPTRQFSQYHPPSLSHNQQIHQLQPRPQLQPSNPFYNPAQVQFRPTQFSPFSDPQTQQAPRPTKRHMYPDPSYSQQTTQRSHSFPPQTDPALFNTTTNTDPANTTYPSHSAEPRQSDYNNDQDNEADTW